MINDDIWPFRDYVIQSINSDKPFNQFIVEHLAGDVVIQKVSALLREVVRQSDIVARWGGEEFLVLMSGCPPKEALQWSEKMRVRIETHDFALQPAETITASFGVASLRENDSREELFARADAALYAAKSQGRNRGVAADDA